VLCRPGEIEDEWSDLKGAFFGFATVARALIEHPQLVIPGVDFDASADRNAAMTAGAGSAADDGAENTAATTVKLLRPCHPGAD